MVNISFRELRGKVTLSPHPVLPGVSMMCFRKRMYDDVDFLFVFFYWAQKFIVKDLRAKGAGFGKFPNLVLMVSVFLPTIQYSFQSSRNQSNTWLVYENHYCIYSCWLPIPPGGPMLDDRGYFAGFFFNAPYSSSLFAGLFFLGGGRDILWRLSDVRMCGETFDAFSSFCRCVVQFVFLAREDQNGFVSRPTNLLI